MLAQCIQLYAWQAIIRGVHHNKYFVGHSVYSTSVWLQLHQVNVLGLCVCNREFMTQLKERGVDEGHIFLINR